MENRGIKYVKSYSLDEKDRQIIKMLFENARYTIAEIAKKTGFRRDSIIYRIKKLEENHVILGFQPLINAPAIGYTNITTLLIKTRMASPKEKEIFTKGLVKIFSVIHAATTMGKYDYQLAVAHESTEQLHRVVEEIKSIVPDLITETEILQVVDEPKYENILGLVINQ